jgi:pyruvate formate lyase activating enzyme
VESVVITGGEPTLASGLTDFLINLKKEGFSVKLDTNGSRPWVLSELIEMRLVDYIAMDYKAPLKKYALLTGVSVEIKKIEETVRLLVSSGIEHEFRLTVVPDLLTIEDVVEAAKELKKQGARKIYLQQFQNEITLDPEFSKRNPLPARWLEDAAIRIAQFMEVEIRGV